MTELYQYSDSENTVSSWPLMFGVQERQEADLEIESKYRKRCTLGHGGVTGWKVTGSFAIVINAKPEARA